MVWVSLLLTIGNFNRRADSSLNNGTVLPVSPMTRMHAFMPLQNTIMSHIGRGPEVGGARFAFPFDEDSLLWTTRLSSFESPLVPGVLFRCLHLSLVPVLGSW